MTVRQCSRGRIFANVPQGAMYIDGGGRFIQSYARLIPVRGCPELEPYEQVEWAMWDTYHNTWRVIDNSQGFEVFPLSEVKSG